MFGRPKRVSGSCGSLPILTSFDAKPVAARAELLQEKWKCGRCSSHSFCISLTKFESICAMAWLTRSTVPLPLGSTNSLPSCLLPCINGAQKFKQNCSPLSQRRDTGHHHTGMYLLTKTFAVPSAVKFGPETAYPHDCMTVETVDEQ